MQNVEVVSLADYHAPVEPCFIGRKAKDTIVLTVDYLWFHVFRQEIRFIVLIFTCVSYAEARNRYRLDVSPVCLSVRLSVTRWYCIKTAEHIVMLFSPHDSPFILVLCISRSSRNSDGVTPCGAAKQR